MRAILLAGCALLAPAELGAAGGPHKAPVFQPPDGPVMISRTVVRSLIDGKEVRATRRYLVWFRREDDGWRIEGELREVAIDVPPLLEQFAEIERNRVEPGFFPILLDSAGKARTRLGPPIGDASRARVLALGEMMIAGALVSTNARNQATTMLTQVVIAGNGGTTWPVDLFNPEHPDSVETRDISLPDGSRGSINIAMRSEGALPGGLPERVERSIVTDLSGTKRSSRETWTFEQLKL